MTSIDINMIKSYIVFVAVNNSKKKQSSEFKMMFRLAIKHFFGF
jgi:hypothetical protein